MQKQIKLKKKIQQSLPQYRILEHIFFIFPQELKLEKKI